MLSKVRQSLSRLIPTMSVAGDGLTTRLRSAWFGLLGVSTAAALALVALVLNLGFPGIAEFPFPAAPAEIGVAQNEKVTSGVAHSVSRPDRTRAPSSSPGDEPRQTPARAAEVKTVESRTIAAVPAPEPVQTEQPPPPSTDGQGSAPQPQSPSSSSPATSLSVPKGRGVGLGRTPGPKAKAKGQQAKAKGQQAKAKAQPVKAKSQPAPVVPTVTKTPAPEDVTQPEKHPGKSRKDR